MALGIVNTISSPSTYGLSISDVTDFQVISGSPKITLKWTDPIDTIINDAYLAVWAGTLIVRKEGSEPKHKSDGTIVIDSKVRDQYKITGFQDSTAQSGKTYYYRAFPYTSGNIYTVGSYKKGRISSTMVALPTVTNTSFVYDPQNSHSPTLNYDSENIVVSGITTAQEGGTYSITFSINNANSIWADSTLDDKTFTWKITPRGTILKLETNGRDWNQEYDYSSSSTGLYENAISVSSSYYLFTNGASEVIVPITEHEGGFVSVDLGNYKDYISYFKRDNLLIFLIQSEISTKLSPQFYNGYLSFASIKIISNPTNNYKKHTVYLNIYPEKYKYYTARIDLTNSDPSSAITYEDDAVNMTPESLDWDRFFGYEPVLLSNKHYYPGYSTEINLDPRCYKAGDSDWRDYLLSIRNTNIQTAIASAGTPTEEEINEIIATEETKINTNISTHWTNFNKNITTLSSVNITSGLDYIEDDTHAEYYQNHGDVMIKFPLRGIRIYKEGTDLIVSMTNHPNDPNYVYYAHMCTSRSKLSLYESMYGLIYNYFYIGAYMGYSGAFSTQVGAWVTDEDDGEEYPYDEEGLYTSVTRLRSLSGKTPTMKTTRANFITYANNNEYIDSGNDYYYSIINWYQLNYLRVMFILKYKTLNSQAVLGYGYIPNSNPTTVGSLDSLSAVSDTVEFYSTTTVQLYDTKTKKVISTTTTQNETNPVAYTSQSTTDPETGIKTTTTQNIYIRLNNDNLDYEGLNRKADNLTSISQHTKLFGLEDFWYTGAMIVNGIELRTTNNTVYVYDTSPNKDTPADGYVPTDHSVSAALSDAFIKDVVGDSILGFFPTSTTGGSATTYFCDKGCIAINNTMAVCNGYKNRGTGAGIFATNFNFITTTTNAAIGTRLCTWGD